MTSDPPTGEPADAGGSAPDLDDVRRHAVRLLAELHRPPRTLRIRAGEVTLDISWPDAGEPPAVVPVPVDVRAETPLPEPTDCLTSPGVGVFYHAKEPGAEPFVSVGSVVEQGDQIGIIEAMKMLIPVEADRGGRISAVLKPNGQPVEYGEPLFALAAESAAG
jgi:acetyl-CoA carboxylase biotin carboxyl carrier protein